MRSMLDREALRDWKVVVRIKALKVPARLLKIEGQKGKVVVIKETFFNGAIQSPEYVHRKVGY